MPASYVALLPRQSLWLVQKVSVFCAGIRQNLWWVWWDVKQSNEISLSSERVSQMQTCPGIYMMETSSTLGSEDECRTDVIYFDASSDILTFSVEICFHLLKKMFSVVQGLYKYLLLTVSVKNPSLESSSRFSTRSGGRSHVSQQPSQCSSSRGGKQLNGEWMTRILTDKGYLSADWLPDCCVTAGRVTACNIKWHQRVWTLSQANEDERCLDQTSGAEKEEESCHSHLDRGWSVEISQRQYSA